MLLATYRSDELNRRHPLRPLIASWDRLRTVQHVELRRFEPGEVAAQLGAILGTEPAAGLVDLVFDRSGGNAYLVEELAGLVRGGGDPADLPPSLADVLLSRVDALSPEAQRLLRTAAVAGRSVPDKLLAEVAGVGDAEFYAGLREAVESHLLVVDHTGRELRVPARADQGRGLRGHAAGRAGRPARRLRRGAHPRPGPGRRRRRGARRAGPPLVRGPGPAARAARLDRRGPARAHLVRPGRGAAPPGAGAGDLAPGPRRGAAHRPGPGRGGEPGRRGRLPGGRHRPLAVPVRPGPGRAPGRRRRRPARARARPARAHPAGHRPRARGDHRPGGGARPAARRPGDQGARGRPLLAGHVRLARQRHGRHDEPGRPRGAGRARGRRGPAGGRLVHHPRFGAGLPERGRRRP